jgi:hypothetical protein
MARKDFNNRAVAMTLANRPSLDRYAQTIHGTMEWVVDVSYRIRENMTMCHVVSIDLIDDSDEPVVMMNLGDYDIDFLESAKEDAIRVAEKYALTLRVQSAEKGWVTMAIGILPPLHPDNWRQK